MYVNIAGPDQTARTRMLFLDYHTVEWNRIKFIFPKISRIIANSSDLTITII